MTLFRTSDINFIDQCKRHTIFRMPELSQDPPRSWTMTKAELERVAEEELNETDKSRRMALKEVREWVRNQEDEDKYRYTHSMNNLCSITLTLAIGAKQKLHYILCCL